MPRTTPAVQTWLAAQDPLRVVPLVDPVIECVGHEPRSLYAETTGALRIFEFPECALVAVREALR